MLIPVDYDRIINTATIRYIEELPATSTRGERAKIVFLDGETMVLNRRLDQIEWCAGPVIQAPPGYSVIRAFKPDKPDEAWNFDTYPVIAFRLTAEEPMPVIPFGPLGESWALVWPDGRCDQYWNRMFQSVDDFKATFGSQGVRS